MVETVTTLACAIIISKGLLSYEAEGTEGGPFHSRKPHVPTAYSGLTIGRGYDMQFRRGSEIMQHLTDVGLPPRAARIFARAEGLKGEKAQDFIDENALEDFEIDECAQRKLFDISYRAKEKVAKRVCKSRRVVKRYGKCDWEGMNLAIREIVTDLTFRGDYRPDTRRKIQASVAANDLTAFTKAMKDREFWRNVPRDRFQRRVAFLESALENVASKE